MLSLCCALSDYQQDQSPRHLPTLDFLRWRGHQRLLYRLRCLLRCYSGSFLRGHWFQLLENLTTHQINQRAETRRRYGIGGDRFTDCLSACCCYPFALIQESREVDIEETCILHPVRPEPGAEPSVEDTDRGPEGRMVEDSGAVPMTRMMRWD